MGGGVYTMKYDNTFNELGLITFSILYLSYQDKELGGWRKAKYVLVG